MGNVTISSENQIPMSAAGKFFSFRGKMGVKFFIFIIVVVDWLSSARAITNGGNGNKSESKLKREDNRRTFNDYQTDVRISDYVMYIVYIRI